MILAFILTIPNNNSWNGKWSGEGTLYARLKTYKGKRASEKAASMIGNHYYRWDDGWGANVQVKEVDAKEARKLRDKSKGFCGYDWMIESLVRYGKIYADHQVPKEQGAAA